jgi:hypothetical protein
MEIPEEKFKKCSECGQSLPLSNFGEDKRYPDRLSPKCQSCKHRKLLEQKKERKKRRAENTDRNEKMGVNWVGEKKCGHCKEMKPKLQFSKDLASIDIAYTCCECFKRRCIENKSRHEKNGVSLEGSKLCPRCGIEKPRLEFGKNLARGTGIHSVCKECRQDRHTRKKFGISRKEIEKKKRDQNFQCAICGKKKESDELVQDHCHITNQLRAILCRGCNSAIGLLDEKLVNFERSIQYLSQSPPVIPHIDKPECVYPIEHKKNIYYKRIYGITLWQFNWLCERFFYCCEICLESKKLGCDHNHVTRKIRGAICSDCNSALGLFYDNIQSLKKAIEYLSYWKEKQTAPLSNPTLSSDIDSDEKIDLEFY